MATNESLSDFGHHQTSLLELTGHCGTTSSTSGEYLSMLCFENHTVEDENGLLVYPGTETARKIFTAVNASNCESSASSSSGTTSLLTNKRSQSGERRKVNKRPKLGTQNQNSCSNARPSKGRKEKLGERITALQQLVSPFGKSDTASVLHEAMGYIRFLHDQVQVLSSSYLKPLTSPSGHLHELDKDREDGEKMEGSVKQDLRTRGLCLVPLAYTAHVANSNGADLWSSAMGKSSLNH
ncbi:hypothetical protein Sjap_022784 [Stephania japonica]|uniref:BHLH domain-containing protein n=1 Tax=Stephania japonica TaxID=461633 RepID=A0AAP0HTY5_9MAGN